MTEFAPSWAKKMATDFPMPESPPVMMATLSFNFDDPVSFLQAFEIIL